MLRLLFITCNYKQLDEITWKNSKKVNGAIPPSTQQSKGIVRCPFIPSFPGFDQDVSWTHCVLLGRWDVPHGHTSAGQMLVCSWLWKWTLAYFWLGWMLQLWVAGDKSKNSGIPIYHILANAEFYKESCIRGPIFAETKGLKVIAHLVWVPKIRVHFWLLNNGYNQFNSLEIKIPQNGYIKSISLFAHTIPFIYGTLIWM